MKRALRVAALGFTAVLSACQVVGPDYQPPKDGAINQIGRAHV